MNEGRALLPLIVKLPSVHVRPRLVGKIMESKTLGAAVAERFLSPYGTTMQSRKAPLPKLTPAVRLVKDAAAAIPTKTLVSAQGSSSAAVKMLRHAPAAVTADVTKLLKHEPAAGAADVTLKHEPAAAIDAEGFLAAVQSKTIVKAPADGTSIKDLDAVIFLDVDGVLHPPNPKHERLMFRRECMELLRDVCGEVGAKIVLSTTWRLHEDGRSAVAAKLKEHGCPPFVSRTPSIAQFQRPREILAWVSKHRPKTWVAVDDWPLLEGVEGARMEGHFVQTRNRFGLQPDTAARICALFAEQRAAARRVD